MRKLAIAAGAFSAAVFAANYILPESWLVKCALGCILAGTALFAVDGKAAKAVKIVFFAMAVGFLCFFIHFWEAVWSHRKSIIFTRLYTITKTTAAK